jgi:hypothetical protein
LPPFSAYLLLERKVQRQSVGRAPRQGIAELYYQLDFRVDKADPEAK